MQKSQWAYDKKIHQGYGSVAAPLRLMKLPNLFSTSTSTFSFRTATVECFPLTNIIKAGTKLYLTLEPVHIVLGIKETPLNELVTSPVSAPGLRSGPSTPRTHLIFSHTTKGQPYNMELLSRFLGSHENPSLPRLIGYELLVGNDGKRTVGFGWFAGVAGVLESLSVLAHVHLELGVASPFLNITDNRMPKALGPFFIELTRSGNVTQGCLSILDELPIVDVDVKDLPALVASYLMLFLNDVGWLPSFPRLMMNEQLATALTHAAEVGRARFGVVGDISCDIEGGLEFFPRGSTLLDPFFKHRPSSLPSRLLSMTIMSVDIPPSSLPLDASHKSLSRWAADLLRVSPGLY
ncbi:uncharacterized protein HD556DRAFT_1492401 [Suillus plorans]|uniref:Uncharacterized protein n=1 Tax=Suillus plorans TaxID=116603 RepID=A0A9P7AHQ3_9AGAM|nr:uncharacterized protein HD556DRAFT_1492401 [Suillus plorans]KAG1789714.1 hypothetical protein HD556DRAFT_1492401 [Suillus plorans]